VAPFKKGPDYIDAAWLGAASGRDARNLDTYMMPPAAIGESLRRSGDADLALVEGNRGLHDGFDAAGSHSTAELAKLLRSPVLLVLDVTKMTRTAAAVVLGCAALDREVNLAGVILNQVSTGRQERVIRDAMEAVGAPPVLGAIPRLDGDLLPGRHLGLLTAVEHPRREEALRRAEDAVSAHVDLDALLASARSAPAVEFADHPARRAGEPVTIGVFRDRAFSFYYPENLEALEEQGAELVFISPLEDERLPEVDGLYAGGGFPEVHAERLSDNRGFREQVRAAVEAGLPIYAECGGLMYLGRELSMGDDRFPMSGVLDLALEQTSRPQGHGYVEAEVDRSNLFHPDGARLLGHEFHYSRVIEEEEMPETVLRLERGRGACSGRDGFAVGRVWASYLHLHALGTPTWAPAFVRLAGQFREERTGLRAAWG
jgi:cobyrinic acid a,c-diamide synthase